MEELKAAFAKNITELRKLRGLTQTELAEMINYSDKSVSKWERGESIPDALTLKQIATCFGVTVDYLLEAEHEKKPQQTLSPHIIKNRKIISLLSAMLVWLIATVLFVGFASTNVFAGKSWMVFVYAVPVSLIVLLIFNAIWGRDKYNFLIISGIVWSVLATLFLMLYEIANNFWLIFTIGIPAEIIIVLWSNIKIKK